MEILIYFGLIGIALAISSLGDKLYRIADALEKIAKK